MRSSAMAELAVQSAKAMRVVVELMVGLQVWWLWVWVYGYSGCGFGFASVGLWWTDFGCGFVVVMGCGFCYCGDSYGGRSGLGR
uniref:Transmembrane protein n=1 Tax=Fagus sylvatica TaxID=28930 RepID=A0A2N9EAT0_FAGSY